MPVNLTFIFNRLITINVNIYKYYKYIIDSKFRTARPGAVSTHLWPTIHYFMNLAK